MKFSVFHRLGLGLLVVAALGAGGCRGKIPNLGNLGRGAKVVNPAPVAWAKPQLPAGRWVLPGNHLPGELPLQQRSLSPLITVQEFRLVDPIVRGKLIQQLGSLRPNEGLPRLTALQQAARQLQEVDTLARLLPKKIEPLGNDLEIGRLPDSLQNSVQGQTSTQRLLSQLDRPWRQPPTAEELLELITIFHDASGDGALSLYVRLRLAGRAHKEGFGKLADRLWPQQGLGTEEVALLRDLQARRSPGTPAADSTPSLPGAQSGIPPPKGKGPLPQAGPEGFRAGVYESATSGLPPIEEELTTAWRGFHQRVEEQVAEHRACLEDIIVQQLHRLLEHKRQEDERQEKADPNRHKQPLTK